jgi:hypothetical protein
MKRFLTLLAFMAVILTAGAQDNGFFKPVDKKMFAPRLVDARIVDAPRAVWLFRPTMQITAVQLTWNKEKKTFDSSPLSSIGPGVSYQHYIEANGEPFNDYGFNALLLLGTDITKISPASLSLAGTFNISVINAGFGYNFGQRAPFILMGAVVKF